MIRYPITITALKEQIRAENLTWLQRARERTESFRQAGQYNEDSSIWSDIKTVYMRLQFNKCAYCERRLEGEPFGPVEHDLEHYRPKNGVKKWPTADIAARRNIQYNFETGEAWEEGYFLLAYHVLNYVTACKVCNTPLKSNYFPIARNRGPQNKHPKNLKTEKPFLIYPLGDKDSSPEALITFDGIIPKPKAKSGHRFRRAQVTIDFFELDTRETLLQERAEQINQLGMALFLLDHDPTLAQQTIDRLTSARSPHSSCARSFLTLYRQNRMRAEEILRAVREYLQSLT